jgi:membrane protease YdiL (CAAX protease family)
VKLFWWSLLVVALGGIQYLGRFTEGAPDRDVLYQYSTAVGALVVYAFVFLCVLAIAGRQRDLLAFRRPRSWPIGLGLAFLLLVGVYITIAVIDPLFHGAREQGLTPSGWEPEHAGAYAANFVVVAGIAPLVEESLFRGLGYSLLVRYGHWLAIGIVGVAFAFDHGLVNAFLELALFGCALAWLRSRTESILPGMIVHATFNAIALVAAVTVQN